MEEIALRQSVRLASLIVGLIAALIYGVVFCYRGPSAAKTAVKSIPLLSFAAAGFATFAYPLVIGALLLSAIGDVALSRRGERAFLIGLISFALAHVLYVLHFLSLSQGLSWSVGVVAIALFALSTEIWLAPHTGEMRLAVRIYVLLISLMGLSALGLSQMPLAVMGAFAFMASDSILAVQIFRMKDTSRWQVPASVTLWTLYIAGQFAILAGAGWSTPLFQFP